MKAMFIGEDGSMGLRNGHVYDICLDICHNSEEVTVFSNIKHSFVCPYSNLNNFFNNWEPCVMEAGNG